MAGVEWTISVEVRRPDGSREQREVGSVGRDAASPSPEDLGLRLAEGKELLH